MTPRWANLPVGWATDLAVLELMGSRIDDRGDHVVVRTPSNPTFHWGNCIFVTDGDTVDDAARWVDVFHRAVPGAEWVAIGLARMPADVEAWAGCGVELGVDEVLATSTIPAQTERPDGYDVRALAGEDWSRLVARVLAGNESPAYETFALARAATQRDLCERGVATFVGAFRDGELVADLGIVDCTGTARYQNVGTAAEHRGRGLASHLLGVAATWAAERGCARWVIVTEATNPAGRVYRRAGFATVAPSVQAYLTPDP